MTFLEKAMEIENETEKGLKREEVIQRYCPSSYDLEAGNGCSMSALEKCRICWNREMPNTELVKTVTLPMPPNTEPIEYCDKCGYVKSQCECEEEKADVSFTDDLLNTGYNKGLNDAWELVEKLWYESDKILGYVNLNQVFKDFTPQEALAKLKAYEEAQIEVGDVVENIETKDKGVITRVKPNTIWMLYSDGVTGVHHVPTFNEHFKKIGTHLGLASILEQIGE